MQKVTVAIGPDKGRVFNLSPGDPVQIGRRGVQVLLTDQNVSRQHAQFLFKDDKWWVIDLGSTNGTFVNGMRLTQAAALKGGDQVQLGRSTLVFHGQPASQRKDRPDKPGANAVSRAAPPTPQEAKEAAPEQVALDVLSAKDDAPRKPQRAIDPNALSELEQYLNRGREAQPGAPSKADEPAAPTNLPKPKPVPNAAPPVANAEVVPSLGKSVRPPPPAEPEAQPQPSAVEAEPVHADSQPTFDVADNALSVQPTADVSADAPPPPPQSDEAAGDAMAAIAVGVVDDQPIETTDSRAAQLAQIDPSRILAVAMEQGAATSDPDEQFAHDLVDEKEQPALASAGDDMPTAADGEPQDDQPSYDAPFEPPTGEVLFNPLDLDGAVDADNDWGNVEESFNSGSLCDPAIDPLYPRDLAGEFAYAASAAVETALIDPAQESDACAMLATTTLAMAVEAEPQIGIVPPDEEEDDLDDDAPRAAPKPVAAVEAPVIEEPVEEQVQEEPPPAIEEKPEPETVAQVEAPAPVSEPQTEPEPEPVQDVEPKIDEPVEAHVQEPVEEPIEETLDQPAAEPEPEPEPEPAPQPAASDRPVAPLAPKTSTTFKRRPATPDMLIEPQTDFDEDGEEDYDYYAWEQREKQILNRRIKIGVGITLGAAALLFAATQAVYIWVQLSSSSKSQTAVNDVQPVDQSTTDAERSVDPLDNIPDSSEDNMSNVLDAMQKQVGELVDETIEEAGK